MLHEIAPHHYHVEFKTEDPAPDDLLCLFSEGKILLKDTDEIALPTVEEMEPYLRTLPEKEPARMTESPQKRHPVMHPESHPKIYLKRTPKEIAKKIPESLQRTVPRMSPEIKKKIRGSLQRVIRKKDPVKTGMRKMPVMRKGHPEKMSMQVLNLQKRRPYGDKGQDLNRFRTVWILSET